ncbi:MAG: hypothetical protein AABY84_12715 [Candidatus Firestonebacteria bacterium]
MKTLDLYLITAGIIMLAIFIFGVYTRCPVCKRLWARKSKGKEEVSKKGGYRLGIQYDIKRDANGKEISKVKKQELVHVIQATYQNYWQCKHCQRIWTTLSNSVYEG